MDGPAGKDLWLLVTITKFLGPGEARQVVLPARSPNLNAYAERWVRRR